MKLDTFIEEHIENMRKREETLQTILEAVREEREALERGFSGWRGETEENNERVKRLNP